MARACDGLDSDQHSTNSVISDASCFQTKESRSGGAGGNVMAMVLMSVAACCGFASYINFLKS
jgi:hypothetical protein